MGRDPAHGRPAAAGALQAIFLVQWVSCDGVEPLGASAWDDVIRGLIAVFASREAAAADEPGHDAAELAVGPMLEWLREVVGIAP